MGDIFASFLLSKLKNIRLPDYQNENSESQNIRKINI
jgi:hypothetical protein